MTMQYSTVHIIWRQDTHTHIDIHTPTRTYNYLYTHRVTHTDNMHYLQYSPAQPTQHNTIAATIEFPPEQSVHWCAAKLRV